MNTNALEKTGEASQIPIQSESSAVLHMIERAARDPAVDMDKMLKLMAMRDQAEMKQSRRLFDESVAAAKAKIPPITRNATGHNNKKYADFAAIAAVVDPILGDNGLSYRFRTVQTDKAITVTCVLFGHGHSEENTLTAPPDNSGNKSPIHSMGSTLTYLQRYTLVQALGLAASNDDDGKAASIAGVNTITQEQADELRDLIEANGKNRAQFLKWAKVERIEDIRTDHYQSCVNAITAKVAK
jgi:hypothetical protein